MMLNFDTLTRNQIWFLVPCSPQMKVIGDKWVFKLKLNPDGSILCHKVKLMAKRFHQTLEVDLSATFGPIINLSTICIILSLLVTHG